MRARLFPRLVTCPTEIKPGVNCHEGIILRFFDAVCVRVLVADPVQFTYPGSLCPPATWLSPIAWPSVLPLKQFLPYLVILLQDLLVINQVQTVPRLNLIINIPFTVLLYSKRGCTLVHLRRDAVFKPSRPKTILESSSDVGLQKRFDVTDHLE